MRLHKGTGSAKRRMSQLRARKLDLEKADAIVAWAQRTGRPSREWWTAAQEAGLTYENSTQEKLAFLKQQD